MINFQVMIIYLTSRFKKSYRKLPRNLKERADEKDKIFRENPFNPILETHKLKGRLKNYWTYSVDENYRVLFRFENRNKVIYFDIDTHEIYKR